MTNLQHSHDGWKFKFLEPEGADPDSNLFTCEPPPSTDTDKMLL